MPDENGKYYFSDYKSELKSRGFDGFGDAGLGTYVNRGYFHVARRSRWYWEETTDVFSLAPGAGYVDLWPIAGGELPNFRALDKLYVTTQGQRRKLRPVSQDKFFQSWLPLDLTSTDSQGEPTWYYVYESKLYILPPPQSDRDFLAHYHQRTSPMVNPMDQPLTPQHLDEAIMIAALIRCHQRANEPGLATLAEAELEQFFDDMRDDEEMLMTEQPSRVSPDDTWL